MQGLTETEHKWNLPSIQKAGMPNKRPGLVKYIPHICDREVDVIIAEDSTLIFLLLFFACLSPIVANQRKDASVFFLN